MLDEHTFAFADKSSKCCCRLQVFAGPGRRPLAVATQSLDEQAMSLTNGAETYAAHVWQKFFADDPAPPLWVQKTVIDPAQRVAAVFGGWQLVDFTVGPHQRLSSPEWFHLTDDELARLASGPVDGGRGDRFVAAVPGPVYRTRYALVPMEQMPLEQPFREPCMTDEPATDQRGSWRRRWHRATQRRAGARSETFAWRTCCWYHGGDWALVQDVAARLIADAETAGLAEVSDVHEYVCSASEATRLTTWQQQALGSFFTEPIGIHANGYVGGQHRTRAMRDAGLSAVLVATDVPDDPPDPR